MWDDNTVRWLVDFRYNRAYRKDANNLASFKIYLKPASLTFRLWCLRLFTFALKTESFEKSLNEFLTRIKLHYHLEC